MNFSRAIVVSLFCLLVTGSVRAASEYSLLENDSNISLNLLGEYFVDENNLSHPEQINPASAEFIPMDPNSEALLLSQQTNAVWIRFTVNNTLDKPRNLVLEMNYLAMDYWDVFIPAQGNYRQVSLGDKRSYDTQYINAGAYAVPFTLEALEQKTIYLRAKSDGFLLIPATLYDENYYQKVVVQRSGLYKILAGIALGLFIFGLMLGIQTRDKIYYVYSGLVLMRVLWISTTEGGIYEYIHPYPLLVDLSTIGVISIYTLNTIFFHTLYLRFDQVFPNIRRFYIGVAAFYIVAGLILPIFNFYLATSLVLTASTITNLALLGTGIWRLKQGYGPAKIYLFAISLPILIAFYTSFASIGFAPFTQSTIYVFAIVLCVSLILFSYALTERINLITKEKIQAEKNAVQARVEAQTKSNVLAQMSHEIRTPMNGVMGVSELLANTGLNENQKKYNDIIHSSGKLLLQVIDDVLDYSKIQAGKMEIEKIPFEPKKLFKEVHQIIQPKIHDKNLSFILKIDDDVPNVLLGDPTRIEQIVLNFVSNACKFTDKGSITLKMEKKVADDSYKISVTDTGIGIDQLAIDNLYTPYYQTKSSTSRMFGGTGLGLSICKQLSELMNGEIGVNSELGKGSEFWISLPLASGVEEGANEIKPLINESAKNKTFKSSVNNFCVLVVEDNPVNTIVAQGMLSSLGHECESVCNGLEAVQIISAKPDKFDMVLMDCEMPVMDGLEATRRVRELKNLLPIVALTAHVSENQRLRCMQAGMNYYLSKPLKSADLREAISHCADLLLEESVVDH